MRLEVISRVPSNAHPTPLLFVHGAWHAAWCWDTHFLSYFADHGFAAHALSLRGHGGSEGRERLRWYRIRDYVDDLVEVAGGLAAPPVLIGHSMGGFVIQKYLEQHSAPAAVLLAPIPAAGALRTAFRLGKRHPVRFMQVNLTFSMYPLLATSQLAREALFSSDIDPAILEHYWSQMQDESVPAFLDMFFRDLPGGPRAALPVLVLGAEWDAILLPAQVEATARVYGTTTDWLPGIAHDVMLETGWQGAASHLLAWLGSTLGES